MTDEVAASLFRRVFPQFPGPRFRNSVAVTVSASVSGPLFRRIFFGPLFPVRSAVTALPSQRFGTVCPAQSSRHAGFCTAFSRLPEFLPLIPFLPEA